MYPFAHICPEYKKVLGLKHQVCEQIWCVSSRICSMHQTALSVHQEKAVLFHANTESFCLIQVLHFFICVEKYAVLGFLQMCLGGVMGT